VVLHKDTLQAQLGFRKDDTRSQEELLKEIYLQCIEQSRIVSPLLKEATLVSPLKSETDYSYAADQFCGPGFFLVGDAACFLDPLLSTGCHLATFSALLAAACLISLSKQDVTEEEAKYFYDNAYRNAYLRLLILVSSFYQQENGVDAYFSKAQELSQVDYDSSQSMQAFIGIVSGEEDLENVQQPGAGQKRVLQRSEGLIDKRAAAETDNGRVLTKQEGGQGGDPMLELVNRAFALQSTVHDLYLCTEPLGLARKPVMHKSS
jgi:hypothetical protein